MFVRITWSKLSGTIDTGLSTFRERVLPSMQVQPGYLGAVLLGNRETLEGASVTYWQTAEQMAASDEIAAAGRAVVSQTAGVQIQGIDRFEMILQDRAKPVAAGTFVRVNDVQTGGGQLDATVAYLRGTTIPAIKSLAGYRAMLVMVNERTAGPRKPRCSVRYSSRSPKTWC